MVDFALPFGYAQGAGFDVPRAQSRGEEEILPQVLIKTI